MRIPPVLLNLICSVILILTTTVSADSLSETSGGNAALRVGVAEHAITPPTGFPMAGYYHERLAVGAINPLKAKAIVFREGDTAAALVVCDLIGLLAIRDQLPGLTAIEQTHLAVKSEVIQLPLEEATADQVNAVGSPSNSSKRVTRSTQPDSKEISHSRSTANTLVATTSKPPTTVPRTPVQPEESPANAEASESVEGGDPLPKRGSAMIEHTVTFRLKHARDSKEEASFLKAAAELATIPGVQDFQLRRQTSPKNRHTFGISMRFDSAAEYQTYNDHPLHVRFVQQRWLNEVDDFQEADFEPLGS